MFLGEFFAIAYLLNVRRQDEGRAGRYLRALLSLARNQPGVFHPISDRFAVSTFSICAALAHAREVDDLDRVVVRSSVWICDRADGDGIGLAGPYSEPNEEVEYLLGAVLDCVDRDARNTSLLAVALIEVAAEWIPARYSEVLNDVLAVGLCPSAVVPVALPDALFLKNGGTRGLLNPKYGESPSALAWHSEEKRAFSGSTIATMEAPLVFASVCRDRLFQGSVFHAVGGEIAGAEPG